MASSVVIVFEFTIEWLSLEKYIIRRTVVYSGQKRGNPPFWWFRPRVQYIYKVVCINCMIRLTLELTCGKFYIFMNKVNQSLPLHVKDNARFYFTTQNLYVILHTDFDVKQTSTEYLVFFFQIKQESISSVIIDRVGVHFCNNVQNFESSLYMWKEFLYRKLEASKQCTEVKIFLFIRISNYMVIEQLPIEILALSFNIPLILNHCSSTFT